jgi:UDP-glucose 4-epimerase
VNFYRNKKVIVTGGAGFIGSHLVEKLVSLHAQVTVLDNLHTGTLKNLESVRTQITFIEGDIQNKELCNASLKEAEIVFHLAAQISVPESVIDPEHCFTTNVTGTFNLLEAARIHKIRRLVFSSSCAVYGEQNGPCRETSTCAPASPYAYSKLLGEQLCQQYSTVFNLPTVVLRYFNVFGPRQNPSGQYAGVIAKFTENMSHNVPITIFGDGTQSRDFVPVHNIVEANLTFAQLPDGLCMGDPINVATGTSSSVLELFHTLKTKFPSYSQELQFAPARVGEIKHSQADCRRYQTLIKQLKIKREL